MFALGESEKTWDVQQAMIRYRTSQIECVEVLFCRRTIESAVEIWFVKSIIYFGICLRFYNIAILVKILSIGEAITPPILEVL